MGNVDYPQIYAKITKNLSSKVKEVFERRFGMKTGKPETLESIGESFGITRERVRQIQEAGFKLVKKNHGDPIKKVFSDFGEYFKREGGFKKEEAVLKDLGGSRGQAHVLFFLNLGDQFSRVCQKKEHHDFWAFSGKEQEVKNGLDAIISFFKDCGKIMGRGELSAQFAADNNINEKKLSSYLEISKVVRFNREGNAGLAWWPEVNPRSVKHKALLVMREHQKPLHFREIARLIDISEYGRPGQKTNIQTVHNELIKDSRFVLVGRGMYALSEWGYVPGTIKDVIAKILREKAEAVSKDDIVKAVLSQRLVAKNTVMINLNNKKYFNRDENGRYFVKEVQTA